MRRRVVVTRAADQSASLAERLERAGFDVVAVPVIRIAPGDPLPTDLSVYDWVAVTSANAVDALGPTAGAGAKVAAVGPGTADALRQRGVEPDLVATTSSAAGLAEVFPAGRGRVLLPQSSIAAPTLRDGLAAKGWDVEVVVAYRTLPADVPPPARAACAAADAVAFTSSSTVDQLVDAVGAQGLPPAVVCIGPSTAATARARGIEVAAVADPHTLDGLVAALAALLGNRPPG